LWRMRLLWSFHRSTNGSVTRSRCNNSAKLHSSSEKKAQGTRRVVEAALKAAGIQMKHTRIIMELDSTEAIKSAVEAGLGVGFVSRRAIQKEVKLDSLREAHITGLGIQRTFAIIYPRGSRAPRGRGCISPFSPGKARPREVMPTTAGAFSIQLGPTMHGAKRKRKGAIWQRDHGAVTDKHWTEWSIRCQRRARCAEAAEPQFF